MRMTYVNPALVLTRRVSHLVQFDYETYVGPFLSKLANYSDRSVFSETPDLAFLDDYASPITNETEQLENVTPSGLVAAAALGAVIRKLYPNLIKPDGGRFRVWAASGMYSESAAWAWRVDLLVSPAHRDVDSANSFIKGLGNDARLVVVNEGENDSANTLTPHVRCVALLTAYMLTTAASFTRNHVPFSTHHWARCNLAYGLRSTQRRSSHASTKPRPGSTSRRPTSTACSNCVAMTMSSGIAPTFATSSPQTSGSTSSMRTT